VTTAVQTGAYVDPARSRIAVGVLANQWIAGKVNLKPSTFALYGDPRSRTSAHSTAATPL
jgi:hypothetical protein